MGVDISISWESRGRCVKANCRGYRPGSNPHILIIDLNRDSVSDDGAKYSRQVFPLEVIPIPFDTVENLYFERQPGDENRYAVEVNVFRNKTKNGTHREIHFERWLTKSEYEHLKATKDKPDRPKSDWRWDVPSRAERLAICSVCPLRFRDSIDCEPSLFSYSTLPNLRRAASDLFAHPADSIKSEVFSLLKSIAEIFPKDVQVASQVNGAANFQQFFENVISDYVPDWNVKNPPLNKPFDMGDFILNLIFFREPEDESEEWIRGTSLKQLVEWLERLFQLLKKADQSSEQMQDFIYVIDRLLGAYQIALKHNLEISISF